MQAIPTTTASTRLIADTILTSLPHVTCGEIRFHRAGNPSNPRLFFIHRPKNCPNQQGTSPFNGVPPAREAELHFSKILTTENWSGGNSPNPIRPIRFGSASDHQVGVLTAIRSMERIRQVHGLQYEYVFIVQFEYIFIVGTWPPYG
jgi:hypothetical protein